MMSCYPSTTDWRGFDWKTATEQQTASRDLAEEYAWAYFAQLTAGAVGGCPTPLRPNRFGHRRPLTWSPQWAYGMLNPYIGADGEWRNAVDSAPCGCSRAELLLPFAAGGIESVEIDGVELDPSAYRVDNGNILVRQDGGVWPAHQDMSLPAGQVGTFVVTVFAGVRPGNLENYAAGVIAAEFLKLITGEKGCRLPLGTTSVTRTGVTVLIDPRIRAGTATGIPEVDMIVRRHNPHGIKRQSRVYSPDTIDGARVTTATRRPTVVPGTGSMVASTMLVPDPANPGFYLTQEI